MSAFHPKLPLELLQIMATVGGKDIAIAGLNQEVVSTLPPQGPALSSLAECCTWRGMEG